MWWSFGVDWKAEYVLYLETKYFTLASVLAISWFLGFICSRIVIHNLRGRKVQHFYFNGFFLHMLLNLKIITTRAYKIAFGY